MVWECEGTSYRSKRDEHGISLACRDAKKSRQIACEPACLTSNRRPTLANPSACTRMSAVESDLSCVLAHVYAYVRMSTPLLKLVYFSCSCVATGKHSRGGDYICRAQADAARGRSCREASRQLECSNWGLGRFFAEASSPASASLDCGDR